jgi:hypothetical protein
MQVSIPEAMDVSGEGEDVYALYGEDARRPGTFAANCVLARRLAERGVRFIQVFHRGWDQHDSLVQDVPLQCRDIDQACAGLILDLKRRGLLDDTLVTWGGEFGRTVYSQGEKTDQAGYGRDHHGRCFTTWLAGGGVRAGTSYGRTDDYSYNIVDADGAVIDPDKTRFTEGAVHVHDLHATILHLLGIDHTRLTHRYQGRDYRLTDAHGHVIRDLLA